MKRVSLVGEDCGGIPALALRKYTNEKYMKLSKSLYIESCFRHELD